LEEFKNESSLAVADRFLKKIATEKTDEILQTKEFKMPSHTFVKAYMDSFRQTSNGIPQILELESSEPGDDQVKEAFKYVYEKQWDKAFESITETLTTAKDSLSAKFEALALNLRGTFAFLMGKGEFRFQVNSLQYLIEYWF
jgi:import receptor subunit TOM70